MSINEMEKNQINTINMFQSIEETLNQVMNLSLFYTYTLLLSKMVTKLYNKKINQNPMCKINFFFFLLELKY